MDGLRDGSVAGIELRSSSITTPPPNDMIKILHPKDPRKSITFQYSKEKHVELRSNLRDCNPDHWSVRVLNNGHTNLTNRKSS